jgi:anti-sigma factor RsiW
MSRCDVQESGAIDLYFYDELGALDRARVTAHLTSCPICREQLQDLHAIRRALGDRPAVASPPSGDWSAFMGRLEEACEAPSDPRVARSWSWRAAAACAAVLTIAALGVVMATRVRTPVVSNQAVTAGASSHGSHVQAEGASAAPADRALAELTEQHLERSKLVVLGLAARDPQQTSVDDWQYERQLAGSLLSDTRLFRLAAQDRGLARLARVMGDLETVLLETSLSDQADPRALERVQTLIRKRDLVVKMQVVGTTGI